VPLAGKRLSYLETARLAHKHGIPLGESLAICVAICEWESRRYDKAWNFNARTGDRSYGLWQINMLGNLLQERLKAYGLKSANDLYKPDENAKAMVKISNHGTNWRPWGAYTNRNYRKSLADARKAVAELKKELKPKTIKPGWSAAKPLLKPKPVPATVKPPVAVKPKPAVKKVATVTSPAWVRAAEPAHDYNRTAYGSRTVNWRTRTMLERAAALHGKGFTLTQGSYNSGVAASAGTHDGGGVVDVSVSGMDSTGRYNAAMALRKAGFFAWIRTPAQGFAYHIHAVAIGDKEMSSGAKSQQVQGFQDRDGLARHGADTAPDPYPTWVDKYGKHVSLDRPAVTTPEPAPKPAPIEESSVPGKEAMVKRAEKDLGLGEPNYIQDWYRARNGSAYGGNFAWCDAAVTKWAYDSGNHQAVCHGTDYAYTVSHAQRFQSNSEWHVGASGIARGDIVFFDWGGSNSTGAIDHVGIVTSVSGGTVYTIEGNISNVCARKVRYEATIAGYGRPKYQPVPAPPSLPPVSLGKVVYALTHKASQETPAGRPDVSKVQLALVKQGVLKPGFAPGVGDPVTKDAYAAYQRSLGYSGDDADGVPGMASLTKLGAVSKLFRVVA
jgi:hypothetical protein